MLRYIPIFFLCLILTIHLPVKSQPTALTSELRGVWLTNVDSDVLFESQKLTESIQTLKQLNFNTLYPTVWNWGYTLYPSLVAKKVIGQAIDPIEALAGRDIIDEIVEEGHKEGMTVIPWFEFGFMAPADSELAKRHPDWLTKRQDKTTIWLEGKVHQRVWLNPLHPEVQKFITDLVLEMIAHYDIDGIQFDDHFGYPSDFGYDELTLQLYQEEHQGKLPPTQHLDQDWIQWRADKITEFMSELFQAIKRKKSQVIVSLSPNPQAFSLQSYLLDWHQWERLGIIEELVIQIYRSNMDDYIRELSQSELKIAKTHIPVGIGILAGLKNNPVSIEKIQKQVNIAREKGFTGVSFFFYESLWHLAEEPLEQRHKTFSRLFPSPVIHPNLYKGWTPPASKSP